VQKQDSCSTPLAQQHSPIQSPAAIKINVIATVTARALRGAQALGFLMGFAALDYFVSQPCSGTRFVTPILGTAVPLFELVFITVVRVRKGLPWWKGSPDHFALRLQRAGLSKSMIDLLAAGLIGLLWHHCRRGL
jgi:hypothetical protein